MLNDWKQRLLSGWNLMRIIRFGLAIVVLIDAWKNSNVLFALLGGIVLFQAIFNMGCCGTSSCDINHAEEGVKSFNEQTEDITFKEVK